MTADDGLSLLTRFDRRWLPAEVAPDVDAATRAGLRRISGDDPARHLTVLLAYYQRARPSLLALARTLLGRHREHAEDLLQDVMRKVVQNPPVLRDPDKVDALFRQAVRNGAITWGTRAARETARLDHDAEAVLELADPAQPFEDTILFHLVVARALASLSPRERAVIDLVDLRRRTVQEAADELGISLGAAKNYRFVGLRRLREDPGLRALHESPGATGES